MSESSICSSSGIKISCSKCWECDESCSNDMTKKQGLDKNHHVSHKEGLVTEEGWQISGNLPYSIYLCCNL